MVRSIQDQWFFQNAFYNINLWKELIHSQGDHCKGNAHSAVKVLIHFLKKTRITSIVKFNTAELVIRMTKVYEMGFQIMLARK